MNKNTRQTILNYLAILSLCICFLSHAGEDEISPETLPDEIPNEQNFGIPKTSEESQREVQSIILIPVEPSKKNEDAKLEPSMTPLFPTEPIAIEMAESNPEKKAGNDEELTQPDPSYIPPQPLVIAPQKKIENDEELTQPDPSYIPPQPLVIAPPKNLETIIEPKAEPPQKITLKKEAKKEKLALPIIPTDPIQTDSIPASIPAKLTFSKPKPTKRPPLILAPELLQQLMADSAHLVPIETFIARLSVPPTTPSRPPKGVSDFSIILSNNEFYPSKIVLKSGASVRLLFTTTNKKSAALVIEKLNIQRWVSSQIDGDTKKELDRTKFEVNRELSANRVTEIEFQLKSGVYSFHDVITGASGEISVEEP